MTSATSSELPARNLDDLLDGFLFAMVATVEGDTISSRPLTLLEHDGPMLRFLVSASAPWSRQLRPGARVHAAFADTKDETYVAVEGAATISRDAAVIERLWNPAAGAFFDGPDDPDIRVLEIEATGGEWWDGPGSRIGQAISLLRTKLAGSPPDGEHGVIDTTA